MRIKQFMNQDFRQFSIYDAWRNIPGIDGFKPSQRKIIHAMIRRGENADEIKVAQMGAYTALHTDYHHGEGSLFSTIIGMAQDYAGANNVNLLMPNGAFGNRFSKEAAAPRYIFTQFSPDFRKLFKKEDDSILVKQYSDGDEIEPELFYPILPVVMVNGAEGTGTGYSSKILSYNVNDVRDYVIARLQEKKTPDLVPWYRGFRGKTYRNTTNEINPMQCVWEGTYEIVNTTTLIITELPIGMQLDDYKAHLKKLKEAPEIKTRDKATKEIVITRGVPTVVDFDDESDSETQQYRFVCKVPRTTTDLTHDEIMQKFKLISRDSENVNVWVENPTTKKFNIEQGKMRQFKDVYEFANFFVEWRTGIYEIRRLKLIDVHTEESRFLSEKLKFILFYLKNTAAFRDKKKADLIAMLEAEKFTDISRLMSLSIWNLTHDEIEKLKKEIGEIAIKVESLKNDTAKAMYVRELKEMKIDPNNTYSAH